MTRIAVTTTWTCATGVAVLLTYCILTHHANTKEAQKDAAAVAERIAKRGTIPEYKSPNRHFSAVSKKTTAKVVDANVAEVVRVENPIYQPFTNALAELRREYVNATLQGDVNLTNGFTLVNRGGIPVLLFPDAYEISAGGYKIGSELPCGHFGVRKCLIPGTDQYEVKGIAYTQCTRLSEPEFYCTSVNVTALPSTKQIDSLRMHGDLKVINTDNAKGIVEEIAGYMTRDYAATELEGNVPAGVVAQKKFKIGDGMDVDVSVKWKDRKTSDGTDATIDVAFVVSELAEESAYQSKKLGEATDTARKQTLATTGINYFTVDKKVNSKIGKDKVVN